MDKALRNTIIAGILLVGVSVAFYFVYYLPNKERKIEEKRSYCNQWALDQAKNVNLKRGGSNDRYLKNDYNSYFERCLREQGVSN
jgi:hypothetical protein